MTNVNRPPLTGSRNAGFVAVELMRYQTVDDQETSVFTGGDSGGVAVRANVPMTPANIASTMTISERRRINWLAITRNSLVGTTLTAD